MTLVVEVDAGKLQRETPTIVSRIKRGVRQGVQSALDRFESEFRQRRLERRAAKSIARRRQSPASLVDAFTAEIDRQRSTETETVGRVYFKGGQRIQQAAHTQEYGATIRPRRGRYLRFQIEGRFARRGAPTPDPKWVQVRQVFVPPRLNLHNDWRIFSNRSAGPIIRRSIEKELRRRD